MKKIIAIIALFTILPYSIFGLQDKVFAQEKKREIIRISPFIFNVTLSPNKTYTYEMTIENLLDLPVPVRMNTEDFQVAEDTGDYSFEKNNSNSVTSWIDIEPKEMILNPKEKKDIVITINTPDKISFGGYHGMIFIEPLFPNKAQYSSLLSTKIGALVLANIGSPANGVNPARITSYETPLIIFDQKSFTYDFKVQSNSLYHFTARPFLHVRPLFGQEQKNALEEKLIFPGKTRHWENTTEMTDLAPGFYTAELRVSLGNGVQAVSSHYFVFLPFYILIIAVILVLSGYFIIKKIVVKRNNRKKHHQDLHNKE